MSAAKESRLEQDSTVFTFCFLAECAIKLCGLGLHGYFGDGMNTFDFLIVMLSLVDLFTQVRALYLLVGMSEGYARALDYGSMALTIVFALECLAKLTGLGVWGYTADSWNNLDMLFAVMGILELALAVGAALWVAWAAGPQCWPATHGLPADALLSWLIMTAAFAADGC
jgi:hypothetical protein